jgi:hypothetical protein
MRLVVIEVLVVGKYLSESLIVSLEDNLLTSSFSCSDGSWTMARVKPFVILGVNHTKDPAHQMACSPKDGMRPCVQMLTTGVESSISCNEGQDDFVISFFVWWEL